MNDFLILDGENQTQGKLKILYLNGCRDKSINLHHMYIHTDQKDTYLPR